MSELAGPGDDECVERLLGQLATLALHGDRGDDDRVIEFVPVPGCETLATRALDALHAPAFAHARRRRFSRAS